MAAGKADMRAWLNAFKVNAEREGLSLRDLLVDAFSDGFKAAKDGSIPVGVTRNGNEVQLSIPPPRRGLTPHEIFIALSRLYELYGIAKAFLISDGDSNPNEESICAEMLRRLNPVKSYRVDHSGLRTGVAMFPPAEEALA